MALEPDERRALALGEALYAIRDTAGFQALEEYLTNLAIKTAMNGVEDTERHIEYWRGYLACAKQIVADVDQAIEDARSVRDQLAEAGQNFAGIRIGSGSLSDENVV